MMWYSDNRMTRAITDKFGRPAIQATGTAAGLTSTFINHNIGCPTSSKHNYTTVNDINRVYADVYEDFNTLNSTHRTLFRNRMLNDGNFGWRNGDPAVSTNGFCPVVRQEA